MPKLSPSLARLLATFFYIGDSPFAPGSAATLMAALIWIAFSNNLFAYGIILAVVLVVGFSVSGQVEKDLAQKDPSLIVIDEVAGGLIAFFMLPINFPVLITAFFLFRAFDMFKIYPVYKFENLRGSGGIMLDDIFAGIYTNLVMHAALKILGG